ncbi:unnamed protein product [Tetraodon nigroviridis]|uniref:(spotted green pufferfish) hypothetical protein n=1 Tax=Tetraodon nigroviridis TaxID=99883 RepID=Q4SDY2_TETNG|nr:unnamed protein product [Tetraodon nigroviridis]
MADSSILTLGTARSLLVDSSSCESTRDHVFLGVTCEDGDETLPKVETRVVLVGEAGRNAALLKALQAVKAMEVPVDINTPCLTTDAVEQFADADNTDFETVFVLTDFDSPQYHHLYKRDNRIMGPPVVLQCAMKEEPLLFSCRPLYSTTMFNLSLCFTGFRDKEEIKSLVNLVHHMGGTIRKDFSTKVTHLIAHSTHGEKYRLAVCMGTPILTPSWIHKAWDKREDIHFHADKEDFRSEFKVPPFQDCVLSFLGFSDEEKVNMEERTLKHGGSYLEVGDERCTHMVVEENSVKELPSFPSRKLFTVKQEQQFVAGRPHVRLLYVTGLVSDCFCLFKQWFWGSIQMDARAGESMYLYEKNDSPAMKKAVSLLSLSTPNSNRKRRRLKDTLAQLTKETEISPFPPPRKRPSAEHNLSVISLLDISNTPDTCKALAETSRPSKNSAAAVSKQSARWQVSKELYQTESNYVGILNTVLQLFKLPLEKEGQVGGPILAQEEIKTIFGSIPDIYDVHTRIKGDLEELLSDWSEDRSVGNIILKYSKELVKAYPPFVNFFEMSKETIIRCERQKPRFHAFLKINQAKPECGRQTLVELLIRPVQRLPSVALLLNDIKKHTADENPDKITLEKAIESLKEVMTHINEDKRKTEGQKQIFDVVYEVDGCPANLLSSHRSLVYRVETIALGDQPCDRGENVTLFLFNDCLEIARKRHKVINTFKSPMGQTRPPPPLKHIALMPLSQIRRVLDLQDTEGKNVVRGATCGLMKYLMWPAEPLQKQRGVRLIGWNKVQSPRYLACQHVLLRRWGQSCQAWVVLLQPPAPPLPTFVVLSFPECVNAFALVVRPPTEQENLLFSFQLTGEETVKGAWLRTLCRHVANTICRADAENLIQCTEPDSVQVSTKDMDSTLSKASRAIKKTSKKMSRSTSTLTLSDSAKSSAAVQRSNSLDHPPIRARVPVGLRVPSSPTPLPPQSPAPQSGPELGQSLQPGVCRAAPKSPTAVAAGLPPVGTSKPSQPKPSQQLPSGGSQARFLVSRNLQVDPRSRAKSSPQRETLL